MRARRRLLAGLMATATTMPLSSAQAYEAYPLHPVHEVLTRAALMCLARHDGARPTDCRREAADVKRQSHMRLFRSFNREEKASTWSDDPVREIAPLTLLRFTTALKVRCARAAENAGVDYTLDRSGLMCGSHFGRLQFLHAMRSAPNEPSAVTAAKMSAWADFTFGVTTGLIDLNGAYCEAFTAEAPAIAADMAPTDCASRRLYGLPFGRWTTATLFTLRCGHVLASRHCRILGGSESEVVARQAAQGALLHLIQDSFSQSHAVRGSESRPFEARIDCALATGFHFYGGDAVASHGSADKPPVLSPSCGPDAAVDDAVTASATAIWMIRRGASAEAFRSYFQTRVLGLTPSKA